MIIIFAVLVSPDICRLRRYLDRVKTYMSKSLARGETVEREALL